MLRARLHAYGTPLLIDEVPAPTPGAGQVVIRVAGAGYSPSDLHVISELPIPLHMPITLGREKSPSAMAATPCDRSSNAGHCRGRWRGGPARGIDDHRQDPRVKSRSS